MNPRPDASTSRLIHSPGWDRRVEATFIRATDDWRNAPEFKSHGHTLRRLFESDESKSENLEIDAVVCTEGRPTVCLKDGRHLSGEDIAALRNKLWNLGATTLLLVEQPSQILVFSTISEPSAKDKTGDTARLGEETIAQLELTELALRLQQFVRRVETGAIYREHQSLFDAKQAVDQRLLKNLRATRDLLCEKGKTVEAYRRAHALIGKFLFSCYLLDRGIIGPPYLKKNRLPEASDSLGLFTGIQGYSLESLFLTLQHDFNGSLFADQSVSDISDIEVSYLYRFLSGEDLIRNQPSFFKFYDFSFIPVELISSIYQEFLGAEAEIAEVEAGTRLTEKNQNRKHGQRKQGAYYTPPRLAELTVDIATNDWDTLLDKRCLDPACGSGIFLVILFVRMAEEWRKRNPNATTEERYNELLRLLAENLCGVDVNPTACLVTCFSLYLAFLDQMEPREITELREALEREAPRKLLPRILWESDKPRPRSPHLDTVRELDFFEMQSEKDFDLVIGNPPWVSRKNAPSAEAWLYDDKRNPVAKEIKKSVKQQVLFPAKELACAFMWKASLHVRNGGDVCQVLPSRVFLSNNTDKFQTVWLKHHRLKSVWLLADYSFILFPNAACPCFIGRYHSRQDNEPLGEFEFVTPKVELLDPREALIPVQPEDQKMLNESDIVLAAERGEAAGAWKRHHWGTPRDMRLIERMMKMPRLSRMVKEPPEEETLESAKDDGQRLWWKGQGFKPFNKASYQRDPVGYGEPKPSWWNDFHPYLPAKAPVLGLVLLPGECKEIGSEFSQLHRSPSKLLFKAPLLLINQACTKFLFSDFDVLFQHAFQAICAPKTAEENDLLFLTAVLASPLSQYFLFHTTANIGIERDKALLEEILELPFPFPEDTRNQERSQSILDECADLLRKLKQDLLLSENSSKHRSLLNSTKHKVNALVYEYFGVCDWERDLIEETADVFRPSSTPHSLHSKKLITAQFPKPQHRKQYADTLVATFRGWTRTKEALWAEGHLAPQARLAMVTFGVGGKAREYGETRAEDRVEEVLTKIRESSSTPEGTVFRTLRGFIFFDGAKVHLLKPLNRRHWTRTAALNDADEILAYMMKEDGWGV